MSVQTMNPIELNLFSSRMTAVCDEMGTVLRRTAFSPNIKDRLDYSCAVFDAAGELSAQAAHIPVHLGSMAFAMGSLVKNIAWQDGDILIINDPFSGGTHLPDITLINPVFISDSAKPVAYVANRAHHADIGGDSPGSMPMSRSLDEEGLIIPPTLLFRNDQLQAGAIQLLGMTHKDGLDPDFAAQASANRAGVRRLAELILGMGYSAFRHSLVELNNYAERLALNALQQLSPGEYFCTDFLDDDGFDLVNVPLVLRLEAGPQAVILDFTASSDQVPGNLNCPIPVTAAAAFYAFRCLMDEATPACAGAFRRIKLVTRPGSIVDAQRPAAVAAGNVETSTRLVDVIFGALAQALPEKIPAASQGSMNNIAMGHINRLTGTRWDYYETLAGGMGAGPHFDGLDAVHTHMTNTLNTPVESVEMHYPLRVRRYQLRYGSGGAGLHHGGCGVIREYEFLDTAHVTLLTERRRLAPPGYLGGDDGKPGVNLLNGKILPGKCNFKVKPGDRLEVHTPGGGGHGADSL
ncbi:MAG: hydantoinase B/oxoprolinase family protein [Pseudohongiellaceae bacterium]